MRTRVLALCALSLAASLPSSAQDEPPRTDERGVRDIAAAFAHHWNTRDASGWIGLFDAQQGSVRYSARKTARGRKEIRRWFEGRTDADARLSSAPRDLRFVSPRLATFDLGLEGDAASPDGTVPSWRLTLYRDDSQWRVLRLESAASYATGVVRVGGPIKEPRKVKHANPVYPPDALLARMQGLVLLDCTISPEGHITNVEVLSGEPRFVKPAVDAVRQWVYTPTLLDEVAVPVIMTITVNFRLQ
jgi:TonB family protein